MDQSSARRVIIVVALVAIGAAVFVVPWRYFYTSYQLHCLRADDRRVRSRASQVLLVMVDKNWLDKASAGKALDIISAHIAPPTRAKQAKRLLLLKKEEINLAYAIVKSEMASRRAKARFFHALESPCAEYVADSAKPYIRLHGEGRSCPGIVLRRELIVTAVDGNEVADKLLDAYYSAANSGGFSWGEISRINPDRKPTRSITANLISSWYLVPPYIALELPKWGKEQQHLDKLEEVLKMGSTQHLCTCSRSVTLSKEAGWKGYFPDESTAAKGKS